MLRFTKALVFMNALIAVSVTAGAQMTPAVVNDPSSPVKVLSVTATLTDFLSTITLKNQSTKAITELQFGLVMGIPVGCGPQEIIASEEKLRIDHVSLAPAAEIHLSDYMLAPEKWASFRSAYQSKDVYSQLAVIFIRFNDGTEWKSDHPKGMYKPEWFHSYANYHCVSSSTSNSKLVRASVKLKACAGDNMGGGQHYICSSGDGQGCSVANATSCTNNICEDPSTCQNQACQAVNNGPVQPLPVPH